MKKLITYKLFESLVDKKIQLLKDLALELQDVGLQVEVINGSHSYLLRDPRVSIHTGTRYTDDYKKFIIMKVTDDNERFDTDLYNTDTIQDFIETLKSYGMTPRSMSGGRHFSVFKFDKHGSMTNSPIVRESKVFEAKKSVVDSYLDKIGATRQDVIDVFQGIIDLGYQPTFKMSFLDKDGRAREEKSTGQETPLLKISFKSDKQGSGSIRNPYVGGYIRFNNLDYIESLYHSLSMFMSMYKDKCNIEYDLDNMVELQLRLQFDTEYDENKVAVTRDDILNALESCLSSIPEGYSPDINSISNITLNAEPDSTIGQRLLDELKASKTAKVVSNYDEVEKIGLDITNKLAKTLSEKFKKDIRYVEIKSGHFDSKSGLYLFNGDKQEQLIAKVRILSTGRTKTYRADVKRGFLRTDKCEIELETLELTIQI